MDSMEKPWSEFILCWFFRAIMEVITPKKLVKGDLHCYLCNNNPIAKERIRIFGKTAHDLPQLIKSALSVDVSVYSENDLFVCTNPCYKRLLKLEKLEKNIAELKEELHSSFNVNQGLKRVKRLRRDSDTDEATSATRVCTTTNPARSFQFGHTTYTPFNSAVTLPGSPFQKPYQLVHNAFGHFNATELLVPAGLKQLLTSTPKAKPKSTAVRTETKVKISVEYPSKTANKTLEPCYESLGKAIVHGPPERIANAVIKCEPIVHIVVKHVMHKVLREVNELCSRKNPSLLRKNNKEDLMNFNMQSLCMEWKERAPVFYAFLMTVALSQGAKEASWLPSVAVAGSILLKQRCRQMSATSTVLAILLKTASFEATLDRFSKMQVTCTNRCALNKLDILGTDYDKEQKEVQRAITKDNLKMEELKKICDISNNREEALRAKKLLHEVKECTHPGFAVIFDNIDLEIKTKGMTISNQNRSYHWVNHKMAINRVSGTRTLKNNQPDILNVPNQSFLPSVTEMQNQRLDYIVLVSRILVEYFKALSPLKDVVIQHIPHKYSNEMSQKSTKVPLGVIFQNENVNEDMLAILKQFHTYLPKGAEGSYDPQLFTGDQLTIERGVNVIASVSNGYTPEDRLEGLNLQLGDWHSGVKILSLIYKRFFSGRSDADPCTLYSDRTLINRRNVKGDPSAAYRADRDFLLLVIKSRVIAAGMTVLGFARKTSNPTNFPLPEDLENKTKAQKLEYLHNAATKIVDSVAFDYTSLNKAVEDVITAQERQNIIDHQELTPDGRFPCRYPNCNYSYKYDGKSRRKHELSHDPPVDIPNTLPSNDTDFDKISSKSDDPSKSPSTKKDADDIYNYNSALLQDGLFFMNFLDAVSEGDGQRVMRQYKYFMLMCKADETHSVKYALECLYQQFLVKSLLSPRDSERFIWNRSVNTLGGKGKNIAMDLDMEHSNQFLKHAIKNLGPNVTEKAVARICHAEGASRMLTATVDKDIDKVSRSGRHTQRSTETDLKELINRAVSTDVFKQEEGRHYDHFMGFERNGLVNLEMSSVFQWINDHKKYVHLGVRAR